MIIVYSNLTKSKSCEAAISKVEELLSANKYNSHQLSKLADYILFAERSKEIISDNRLRGTILKRETSFEELSSKLEGGEDSVYNLISDNKNIPLTHKISITNQDVEQSSDLRQLREAIDTIAALPQTKLTKKMLIEMRRDQYIIKMSNNPPVNLTIKTKMRVPIPLNEQVSLNKEGEFVISGFSLLRADVCAAILQNYSRAREGSSENLDSDLWAIMQDFDALSERALSNYPILLSIVTAKIDGLTNNQICELLFSEHHVEYSPEYISSLWCHKIPKLIADKAQEEWLDWYYVKKKRGKYKRCSRCGCNKLAIPRYFTRNKTSKDGLYSVCKECRANAAKKEVKKSCKKPDVLV